MYRSKLTTVSKKLGTFNENFKKERKKCSKTYKVKNQGNFIYFFEIEENN